MSVRSRAGGPASTLRKASEGFMDKPKMVVLFQVDKPRPWSVAHIMHFSTLPFHIIWGGNITEDQRQIPWSLQRRTGEEMVASIFSRVDTGKWNMLNISSTCHGSYVTPFLCIVDLKHISYVMREVKKTYRNLLTATHSRKAYQLTVEQYAEGIYER